jgi:predicted RNA methylase
VGGSDLSLDALVPDPENRRAHGERNLAMVAEALRQVGAARSIVIDEDNVILAGNGVIAAAALAGLDGVRVVEADGREIIAVRRRNLTPEQKRALALFDNRAAELATWDVDRLAVDLREGIDLSPYFSNAELQELWPSEDRSTVGSLVEQFGVPPFSVLDARQGYWQARKRGWLALGIESEIGRPGAAPGGSRMPAMSHGPDGRTMRGDGRGQVAAEQAENAASIFDPVICELAYRWFCPPGGAVLDPFAGGSVRGVVASKLGRRYLGIELRAEQVAANRTQALALCTAPAPEWIEGDARRLDGLELAPVDLVFTCPPYGDLERYSDDPRDLSQMVYEEFVLAYRRIVRLAMDRLAEDRFALVVVSDFRDRDGFYRGFVVDTVRAFEDAGGRLYNDAVLLTAPGSARLRARRLFVAGRKLAKVHQNVLVFCKGDPKRATKAIGVVDFGSLDAPAN